MLEFAVFAFGFICGILVMIMPIILTACEIAKEERQKRKRKTFDGQEWG